MNKYAETSEGIPEATRVAILAVCSLLQIGQTRELAHLEWNRGAETIRSEIPACVHSKIGWDTEVVKHCEAMAE